MPSAIERLPTELRLKIFEHLLTYANPISRLSPRSNFNHYIENAIMRANKLIYTESKDVFYSINTFKILLRDMCVGCSVPGTMADGPFNFKPFMRPLRKLEIQCLGGLDCCADTLVEVLVAATASTDKCGREEHVAKLKEVTVALRGIHGIKGLLEGLREAGRLVRFQDVGRFTVINTSLSADEQPHFNFRDSGISACFDFYAQSLPHSEILQEQRWPFDTFPEPLAKEHEPKWWFLKRVKELLREYHAASTLRAANDGGGVAAGWSECEHSQETLEQMTVRLDAPR